MGDDTSPAPPAAAQRALAQDRRFDGLDDATRIRIHELATPMVQVGTNRELSDGDVLCREGDDSCEAFVVVDGCIEA